MSLLEPLRARLGSILLVAALDASFTVGCSAQYVTRGVDLYAAGNYVDAAEVFEHTEGRLADASNEERARYGLYRGATLLSLGDAERSYRWLDYSERVCQSDPGALNGDERTMLRRALRVHDSLVEKLAGTARTRSSSAPIVAASAP